jgi:uncharacterized protein (TIGR03000 family)
MTRNRFVGLAVATVFALAANQAQAGHHWGSCGSCGGSYGSWGSGGGSYGSWGSSGGSYGSWGSSGGSFGSWGGHGSSGGSWGSSGGSSGGWYGSSGSSGGSYGSYGSSGGSYGGAGGPYYGGASYAGAPTVVQRDSRVHFALTVPADARVYLLNQPTTVTGTVRHFVTPELTAGREYSYTIRVEVLRNGTTYAANSEMRIRAGENVNLAYAAPANSNQQQIAARAK